jgi:hypothetical protein
MEIRPFWGMALLASIADAEPLLGIPLTSGVERDIATVVIGACCGGFPWPASKPDVPRLAVESSPEKMGEYWRTRFTSEEPQKILAPLCELAEKIRDNEELRSAVERLPRASDVEQTIVCNTFRVACTLRQVDVTWVWAMLTQDEWWRSTFIGLGETQLHALCWGLVELQRCEQELWKWQLPHVLVTLGEALDLRPEQRRVIALMALRSAVVGRAMGAMQRLIAGRKTPLIREAILDWKRQFEEVRNVAPPVVAGLFRDLCATLSRYT